MKKIGKKGWIAIGVIAVILIAWFFLRGGKKEEKITFETAKVENTSIHTSITATGTIEPVTSVTVGTQVSRTSSVSSIRRRPTCRVPRAQPPMSRLIIIGIRRSMRRDS